MPAQMPRGRFPLLTRYGGGVGPAGQSMGDFNPRASRGVNPRGQSLGLAYFRSPKFTGSYGRSGVTRDSAGATLGGCTVDLYRTGDDSLVARTTSDGSGNYTFRVGDNAGSFYIVAYKTGAPDLAGTTVNTLALTWNGDG